MHYSTCTINYQKQNGEEDFLRKVSLERDGGQQRQTIPHKVAVMCHTKLPISRI